MVILPVLGNTLTVRSPSCSPCTSVWSATISGFNCSGCGDAAICWPAQRDDVLGPLVDSVDFPIIKLFSFDVSIGIKQRINCYRFVASVRRCWSTGCGCVSSMLWHLLWASSKPTEKKKLKATKTTASIGYCTSCGSFGISTIYWQMAKLTYKPDFAPFKISSVPYTITRIVNGP